MSEQNEEVKVDDLRPDGMPNAVEGERDVRADDGAGDKGGDKGADDKGEEKPVTEERLTQVLETLVTGMADKGSKGEQTKELSQEEIETLLNVYKPTEKLVDDLAHEDKKIRLAAIKELVSGVVKQSNTMADARIQQLIGEMREKEITPLQKYYEEVAARREEETFYAKNDDLKPYELIVNAVSAKLEAAGKKFDDKGKLFDEIARVSREAIKSMGITPKKGATGSASRVSSNGGSRMSALSGGSGGRAAGGSSGGSDNRRPGMAIFDDKE
jgi:hypothetical protein